MRDSFVFYRSYYEAIELLPKSQRADAYRAIFELMFNDNDITDELPNTAKAIFLMAKPTLEASNKKYEAGKKGAEAKKKSKNEATSKQPTKQTPSKEEATYQATSKQPTKQNGSNVNVNVNVNENVNVEDKEPPYRSPLESGDSVSKRKLLDKCKDDVQIETALKAIGKDFDFLEDLLRYRRAVKKPLKTTQGVKGLLKDFYKSASSTGKSVDELFALMQEREWLTVKPEYFEQSRASPPIGANVVDLNKRSASQAIEMMRQKGVANG